MTEATIPETGLSEVERVVDVFIAPTKTFTDILRKSTWWLPCLIMVLSVVSAAWVVDRQVGYARVAENQIHQSPKQEERFNELTPEQKAAQLRGMTTGYRYTSYGAFAFILIFVTIEALLYWASFNFGFGASTTFGKMFAVVMYAGMPRLISGVLAIVLLLAGVNIEGYDMRNPVGTNLAYYMPDAAPWLKAGLSFFDVIGLWCLALAIIGTAIVAKVSRGQAAAVVLGWWLIGLIATIAVTAATT